MIIILFCTLSWKKSFRRLDSLKERDMTTIVWSLRKFPQGNYQIEGELNFYFLIWQTFRKSLIVEKYKIIPLMRGPFCSIIVSIKCDLFIGSLWTWINDFFPDVLQFIMNAKNLYFEWKWKGDEKTQLQSMVRV